MNWIALIGAGLCEVAFTFCMGRLKAFPAGSFIRGYWVFSAACHSACIY